MQLPDISKITIDKIHLPVLENNGLKVEMLRLDKIHPVISGNKWFKLKYHLEKFFAGNYKGILTFGGAWSNHIVAAACACFQHKIKSTGIIRGEEPENLSATLQQAKSFEMDLRFISREDYKKRNTSLFLEKIKKEFPDYYIIPEGGAGIEGEKGAGEMLNLAVKNTYTHIACAIGTATMFNGIINTSAEDQQLIGIPVLKGWKELNPTTNSKIFSEFHFGGYAKKNDTLIRFMNDFFSQTSIPTDFVYTGKLVYAVCHLAEKKYFPDGSKILLIHSGGLQGNSSLTKGTLIYE